MHKKLRPLLVSILFLPAISLAWDDIDKDLGALSTNIREVWSGGHWELEDANGFYRFVVAGGGYEHYKSKLYVQWIRHGSDMELPVVIETTEVIELNANPIYAFGLPECAGGWECSEIEVNAMHAYEHTQHKFRVLFRGVGRYEFKNAL